MCICVYILWNIIAIKTTTFETFETTWIEVEEIMLSKISEKEKDKHQMVSLICEIYRNQKKKKKGSNENKPITKPRNLPTELGLQEGA